MTDQSRRATDVRDSKGVQVGTDNTQQIIETYIAQQVVQPAAERAECIVVGEVPQRAPAFQPRPELMAILEGSGPGISVVRAVTGMRGVGKTQLAAAYARDRIDDRWQLVAWINAAGQAQVLGGLADTAAALGLGQPGQDLTELGHLARHWLEANGDRCLLVFDNADDLDLLTEFMPAAGQCQVVITSNQEGAAVLGTGVPVEVFTAPEAIEFLARRSRHSGGDGAAELAAELGYLPLALAQAAAVIATQRLSYTAYLDRLRAVPVRDYLRRPTGEPYPLGVAEAITVALDSAVETDPTGLSLPLLNLLALLAETGVSRSLLHTAGQIGILTVPDRTPVDPAAVDEALGHLASRSLATFSIDATTVTEHRLTMRVARERAASNDNLSATVKTTADLLNFSRAALGEPKQTRSAARDLAGQVMALHEHIRDRNSRQESTQADVMLRLRNWAVYCLNELGDSAAQAIVYGSESLADHEQVLGAAHPDTLQSRNNLATAYHAAGRLYDAIALYERTLTDRERTLGGTHPDTLQSRNNLAAACWTAGRLYQAIALHELTLTDREQTLGDTHPDTLQSRNNLAVTYHTAGRLDEAIALHGRTLTDRERTLGDMHFDTLQSRNNLAVTYHAAGRLDEAIPLLERALTDFERALGGTHPDTLHSRNNLATAYRQAGRLDEAIALHERTLTDREQALGDTHPHTLQSRNNLAIAYQTAGRLDQAISVFERSLTDHEHTLGHDHPSTVAFRRNLAAAYQEAGRLDEVHGLRDHHGDL